MGCPPDRWFAAATMTGYSSLYRLSRAYQALFTRTYEFCLEIVRAGEHLDKHQQRVRYWGTLALLRCVMSSPATAVAALETRHKALASSEDEPDFRSFIFESAEDQTDDGQPTPSPSVPRLGSRCLRWSPMPYL